MAIALIFWAYQQQGLDVRLLLNYSNVAAIVVPVNRTQVLNFVARSVVIDSWITTSSQPAHRLPKNQCDYSWDNFSAN